jgi:CDP-diacylglycerol--glycerol-3-phosphate 3-phosphatidyltransferase
VKSTGLKRYIPNILSAVRIILIIPFVMAIDRNDNLIVIITAATIVLTDYLDGRLARAWNAISSTGKILDPLADKICTALAGISIVHLRGFPLWLLILFIVRDFGILIAGLILMRYRDVVPASDMVGRFAMGTVAVCLSVYLFDIKPLKLPTVIVTVVIILVSAVSYGYNFYRVMHQKTV